MLLIITGSSLQRGSLQRGATVNGHFEDCIKEVLPGVRVGNKEQQIDR